MDFAILNISGDAAAIAVGVGAAALIAAVTAQFRLRAQLKHDAQMRERDATRAALDAVVTEITEAIEPMNQAAAAFQKLFVVRTAKPGLVLDQELDDAANRCARAFNDFVSGAIASWRQASDSTFACPTPTR